MFIPLEGENILCLANVIALYREEGKNVILRRDGAKESTPFSPQTLKNRGKTFWDRAAL